MATVTISQTKVEKERGMVILPLKEYQKLIERAVPTYYLTGKEAKALDTLVEGGIRDYRAGKTITARSLGEARSIYEQRERKARGAQR